MSFLESVDDMISEHNSSDAIIELQYSEALEIKDRHSFEELLRRLILQSLAHARRQVQGRQTGSMTFDQAMEEAKNGRAVTRPDWDIFVAVWSYDESFLWRWRFDNIEGAESGDGTPYRPTDEDRAATDWMPYQPPEDNWVDLELDAI